MNAYPLFIFGAGASFDSLDPSEEFSTKQHGIFSKWKPPLTKDLFDQTRFSEILKEHPGAERVDRVVNFRMNTERSFEDILTHIIEKQTETNPEWFSHLMSTRFYLQRLFSQITDNYYNNRNNYGRLLDELEYLSIPDAFFVSFNYDLLFEKNIPSIIRASNVDSYVSGNFKVLKIHGAYNWFRCVGAESRSGGGLLGGEKYLTQRAKYFFELESLKVMLPTGLSEIHVINKPSDWGYSDLLHGEHLEATYYIPEIALPFHGKREHVCPVEHVETLKEKLTLVDRVIVIGWKAADEFILNLLKGPLSARKVPMFVVSGGSSDDIVTKLRKHGLKARSLNNGFSSFLRSGNCQKILSAKNIDSLFQSNEFDYDGPKIVMI